VLGILSSLGENLTDNIERAVATHTCIETAFICDFCVLCSTLSLENDSLASVVLNWRLTQA